ncbi:MAG: M20/M25/M40 family metallo-hydrolase [Rhodopirellula sp.]|nr:M20/M25/M40 family metallo-hydrolase [Rhodopirellula sp.]
MHTLWRTACRSLVVTVFLCFALPWAASAVETGAAFLAALESITPTELQSHVDYLADDLREGREAGTRGGREAGDYLAARLEALGFRPAGPDGGFYQHFPPNFRNVLALLPGSGPELEREYIVLGAHYDHVGRGTKRNSPGPAGEIHNGADDNASGTSAVLEILEALSMLPESPRRSILVAFWDAEEKGLLGSKHWTAHPTVPLERMRLSINMDMVGRLRDDRMIVMGSRTGYGLRRLVCRQNVATDLLLDFPVAVLAVSDHHPFFAKGIPAITLHTDVHDDYHRPSDDADRINAAGMRRIARLMFRLVHDLANQDEMPAFREASRQETDNHPPLLSAKPAAPVRLGATWAAEQTSGPGVELKTVAQQSPAQRAGIRAGDRIVELAGQEIAGGDELIRTVMTAEESVQARVIRAGHEEPVALTIQLDGRPLRLGVAWRVDDAEPGTVILSYILPGSPADLAGLQVDDRVYQVAGRDLVDEADFADRIADLPAPLELIIERKGRIRRVVIAMEAAPTRRAG